LHKYIMHESLDTWIRNLAKSRASCSIIWKVVLKYFDLVEEGLAWKIGNGTQVRLGVDPWPGSGHAHILPHDLLAHLHD